MRLFYLLLLCLVVVNARSQATSNKVSGKIKDMDTGQPVESAVITITFNWQPFSDTTDASGDYVILTNVQYADDNFPIHISRVGYHELNGFVRIKKETAYSFSLKKIASAIVKEIVPEISLEGYATNNWVFLLDVSTSMNMPDKLPLIQKGLKSIVDLFRKDDQVAIVTFSGAAKEILPSTNGLNKEKIFQVIDAIQPGGKSAGAVAVQAAYQTALNNYIPTGNNRIIITTDGLFTSGEKDIKQIKKIMQKYLVKNIHCSVFIVGKPSELVKYQLQKMAEAGKGNFAIISDEQDARQKLFEEAKAVNQ